MEPPSFISDTGYPVYTDLRKIFSSLWVCFQTPLFGTNCWNPKNRNTWIAYTSFIPHHSTNQLNWLRHNLLLPIFSTWKYLV